MSNLKLSLAKNLKNSNTEHLQDGSYLEILIFVLERKKDKGIEFQKLLIKFSLIFKTDSIESKVADELFEINENSIKYLNEKIKLLKSKI